MNGFCVIAVIKASRSRRVSEVLAENTTVTAPRIAMKMPRNSTWSHVRKVTGCGLLLAYPSEAFLQQERGKEAVCNQSGLSTD